MKVLIGTTNPSKIRRFEELLSGCDIEFLTLKDLGITNEPRETGNNPEENAIIKADYYGRFFNIVICSDSGLYFDSLSLNDSRQPGLHIRTPRGSRRLDDEDMITYYSNLVHSLGGKLLAYYLDGIAVYNKGRLSSFMEKSKTAKERVFSFYMVDTPAKKRHAGWPLDSLSLDKDTLTYFVDDKNDNYDTSKQNTVWITYQKQLIRFLRDALGIPFHT